MDVVGSEIGMKMRSAIKAKLTELGCYVDDELPDYVMVMVANKRTRAQMEDDLQLFLGDNTELFVNWLHQVLKKLQEVTVAAPIKTPEQEKSKEKDKVKDKKAKDKKIKDKSKKSDMKKAKKKEKEKLKSHRKKEDKKAHKKKKSKHDDIIRPNIPPLLMNIEKESEPSITDVFAGQILKNHGIILDTPKESPKETKPDINIAEENKEAATVKRPMVPIIDPSTIQAEPSGNVEIAMDTNEEAENTNSIAPRDDQLKEINEIEAKIQGLKHILAEQLDSMSDDEDFLNIRTEAEELMNDFAEDVLQEISQHTTSTPPIATLPKSPIMAKSPLRSRSPLSSPKSPARPIAHRPKEPDVLPQIELKLPKRPVRERLGTREETKKPDLREKVREEKKAESPERFTPEREPEIRPPTKSAKSRLGDPPQSQKEPQKKLSVDKEKYEPAPKRLTSKVSVLENRNPRVSCASVVRVRPRPRVPAPASSLLLRAVADAHKSLLTIPPKKDLEPTVKRALVLPMRRCEPQKIVIQVPGNNVTQVDDIDAQDAISLGDPESEDSVSKMDSDIEKEEYVPKSITKKFHNTNYIPAPPKSSHRTSTKKDDTIIIETLNIHNPTVDKDKNTKFIVTMDGYHPNAFLAKKLQTEGLLNDDDQLKTPDKHSETVSKLTEKEIQKEPDIVKDILPELTCKKVDIDSSLLTSSEKIKDIEKKRLSDTSEESDTQVIIEKVKEEKIDETEETIKRKSTEVVKGDESPPTKRKRSSPIVFNVEKKEKEKDRERQRTESASSDNHVVVTTATNSHKYDSLPPLSTAERKPIWCRAFPQCRYGAACAFQHPRCRFAAACTRRNCSYSHTGPPAAPVSPVPVLASHVVPAANYKSISATPLPAMCKYYPACSNSACHFYHPKPCRYGKACANKFDCNFYHADVPSGKWRYPV